METQLRSLMTGPHMFTLARMICFFSWESRYLHPRELKIFWESLTEEEKAWWVDEIAKIPVG